MSASRSDTIIHERDYESALEGRTSWFLRASASGRNRGDLAVRYGISEGPVSICGRPLQDRENVWIVAARGRMLSSVRPVMQQEDSRRPVWEFADRVRSPKVRSKASAVIAIDGTGGPLSVLVAKQSQPNFMRRFSESSPTPPPRPPQSLPVVRYDAKARQRSLDMLPWGLIPYWVKDINVGFANVQRKGGGHRGQASFRQSL